MHLGRFHAAIHEVASGFAEEQIIGKFDALINTLQASISDPNNPDQAQSFRNTSADLRQALSNSSLNKMSPLRQRIFDDMGISWSYGIGLRRRIEGVLQEQNATPALALKELNELRSEMKKVHQSLLNIDSEFGQLKIEYEELDAGTGEVGFSIPETYTDRTLASLSKEAREIDFIVSTFNEVVQGEYSPVEVKTLASTDWQFFIDLNMPVLVGLTIAIERIVALYKTALDIKKTKADLESKQVSAKALEELQKDIDERLDKGLKKLAEDFVEENYKEKNKERQNELSIKMSMAFTKLAARIDAGVVVEVRAMAPEEPKFKDGAVDENERASQFESYQRAKAEIEDLNMRGRLMHDLTVSDLGQRLIVEKIDASENGSTGNGEKEVKKK